MAALARCIRAVARRECMRWHSTQAAAVPVGLAASQAQDVEACAAAVAAWQRPHTPGPLSEAQLQGFYQDGFIIVHDVLEDQDIQPAIAAVEGCVDELARDLYTAGLIQDKCESEGFYTRLTAIERQFPHASVLLHKRGILPQAIADLWANPKLLDIAQQVVGPNVAGHPVWNLRCKTPQTEQSVVPWHQDTAYLTPDCWSVLQLTAWLPLLNATKLNGCMEVVRGGHLSGRTATHTCCVGDTWYVDLSRDKMVEELGVDPEENGVVCEVPLGSVLLLNNLIPHRSLDNMSNDVRWSLDLRWQDPAQPTGFPDKDAVMMRKAVEPQFQVEWGDWTTADRLAIGMEKVRQQDDADGDAQDARFDTTVAGPWMDNWEMTHENRHTAAWTAMQEA